MTTLEALIKLRDDLKTWVTNNLNVIGKPKASDVSIEPIEGIDASDAQGALEELSSRVTSETYNIAFTSGVRDDGSYIVKKGNIAYLHIHAYIDAGFTSRLTLGYVPTSCLPPHSVRFICSGNTVQNGYLDGACSGFIAGDTIIVGDYVTGTLKEVCVDLSYVCAN